MAAVTSCRSSPVSTGWGLPNGTHVYCGMTKRPYGTFAERDQLTENLTQAFADASAAGGIDVVIDYLCGRTTELLTQAITRKGLTHLARPIRLVNLGNSAGETISLTASVPRSSSLEICGSGAGSVSLQRITAAAIPEFLQMIVQKGLKIRVETAALSEIAEVWERPFPGRSLVTLP